MSGSAEKLDRIVSLTHGERWFVDGFAVLPHPQGVISRLIDLSQAQLALQALRSRGLPGTWTHLFLRAAALGLARCPDSHQVLAGYKKLYPAHADIGLSIAGKTNYAPVLIIPRAEDKPLPELISFLAAEVPKTREKEERDLAGMTRTGWIIPFGALRRFILRLLGRSLWFRRRLVGTFQLTCMPNVDFVYPLVFYSGSALGIGRVADRVLAVNGQPVVRPTAWFVLAIDHKSMDGRVAGLLLDAMVRVLESDELVREAEGDSGHQLEQLEDPPARAALTA
jgi:pyruvate/2-oxoglutarate dehydrogenase complex dihydrolipoamide acyltransferase (E2) component